MAEAVSRPAWAEVDLDAVRHNAATLLELASPAALCAVVKADGYGHGAVAVARAALEAGATRLGGSAAGGAGAAAARRTVPVHVKVDTGMHRVGAGPDVVADIVRAVEEAPALRLEGLWTHFAVADEADDGGYTTDQVAAFEE